MGGGSLLQDKAVYSAFAGGKKTGSLKKSEPKKNTTTKKTVTHT